MASVVISSLYDALLKIVPAAGACLAVRPAGGKCAKQSQLAQT